MTEIFPPYYRHYEVTSFYTWGNGDAQFSHGLQPWGDITTGGISTLNQNLIQYPGDSDGQDTNGYEKMQIYFQSPVSGQLRIVATLVSGDSKFFGSIDDESGWSNAHIKQQSEVVMYIDRGVDSNDARYQLFSYSRGEDEGTWFFRIAEPGEVRQYQYIPNSSFTAGQWVLLEIMIGDWQNAWVNDMQFSGDIYNNWVIRKLDVTRV